MEHKKEKEQHTGVESPTLQRCGAHKTLTSGKKASWNMELAIYRCYLGVGDLGETHIHTQAARRMGRRAWLPAQAPGRSELWVFANSFPILYLQRGGPVVSRRAARSETASAVLAVRYPPSYGGALATLPSAHTMHKNSHTRDSKIKKTYVVSLTVCSTAAVIYLGAQRANKGWARLKRKYGHSMG